MAKVVIEYWECDCCKERFEKEGALRKVEVPSRKYDSTGEKFVCSFTPLMLCQTCLSRLWAVSDRLFAQVEVGNGKVYVFPSDEELPEIAFLEKE